MKIRFLGVYNTNVVHPWLKVASFIALKCISSYALKIRNSYASKKRVTPPCLLPAQIVKVDGIVMGQNRTVSIPVLYFPVLKKILKKIFHVKFSNFVSKLINIIN